MGYSIKHKNGNIIVSVKNIQESVKVLKKELISNKINFKQIFVY